MPLMPPNHYRIVKVLTVELIRLPQFN